MSQESPRITKRPFGLTGDQVSAFGLGLGALAQAGPAAPWSKTLDAALELGVTFLDAGAGPVRPLAESQVGDHLRSVRNEVFLSTRCEPGTGARGASHGTHIASELTESLRRMKTDRVDLYQVHAPEALTEGELEGEVMPALVSARERGDARMVGASGRSLEQMQWLLDTFPLDAILVHGRLDLMDGSLAETVLPRAEELGVAVINASPLRRGMLAGGRPDAAAHVEEARRFETIQEVASELNLDLPRLALGFAAAETRVATTVVGCAAPAELQSDLELFSRPLDELERGHMDALFGELQSRHATSRTTERP